MRLAHPFETSPRSTKRRRKPGPWDADWEAAQAKFARILQRALGRMEKRVWEKIQKEARRRKALPDVPDDPEFWDEVQSEFFDEVKDKAQNLLLEGVTQAEALGLGINFELVNQQVLDYTRTYSSEWWSRVESSTREGLRTAIATHIETGAPLSSLRKSITPIFGARRADMIASTEVTRLFAEGNKIAYRDAGVMELEWRSVMDERVCIDCDSRNGQRYPINDPKATPPLHVRCRCWIAPVVAGKPLTEQAPPRLEDDLRLQESADRWSGYASREIRKAARSGEAISQQIGDDANRLVSAVRASNPIDETLYRGIVIEGDPAAFVSEFSVGENFDIALSSASRSKQVAIEFDSPAIGAKDTFGVVMEIERGSQGLDIAAFSDLPGEQEVIISGRFEITKSAYSVKDNVLNVTLRQIGRF